MENAKTKLRHNLKQYGLTPEQFQALLEAQNYKCAICGSASNKAGRKGSLERLYVDHCHGEGRVRGLLCNSCNVGLGHFGDSPELLEKAIQYLKR